MVQLKKKRERNDLAGGPRSGTERNNIKKLERAQPYVHYMYFISEMCTAFGVFKDVNSSNQYKR